MMMKSQCKETDFLAFYILQPRDDAPFGKCRNRLEKIFVSSHESLELIKYGFKHTHSIDYGGHCHMANLEAMEGLHAIPQTKECITSGCHTVVACIEQTVF
jgi:hypothetical protein